MHTPSFVEALVGGCCRAGQFVQWLKSLPVVGNQALKSWSSPLPKRLGAQDPQSWVSRKHFGSCASAGTPASHFALAVPWLAPAGASQVRLWGHRGVTSTPSSDEACCYHIISLSNKTSKIFNLVVPYSLSWVQAALFYISTYINIIILPTSG